MKSTHLPIEPRINSGVSLIEVLVTVVILGVGLLGLANMHLQGLKNNQSAYFRSQATILAYTVLDAMRANTTAAINGNFDTNFDDVSTTGEENTSAESDLSNWKSTLRATLPSGKGYIHCTKDTAICKVSVQWDDSVGLGGKTAQQFSVVTELLTL
jgi:type IV pilus assembly protein PilV